MGGGAYLRDTMVISNFVLPFVGSLSIQCAR